MSFSINQIMLVGNVTQDPELKYTPNGKPVLTFSMATNRRVKKGEEWTDVGTFHKIVVWGNFGEWLAANMSKGQPVCVRGRLDNRSYTDNNNVKKYITEIVADDVIPFQKNGKSVKPIDREQSTVDESLPIEEGDTPGVAEDIPF